MAAVPAAHAANITVNSAADPAGFDPNIIVATLGNTITLRCEVLSGPLFAGDIPNGIKFDEP